MKYLLDTNICIYIMNRRSPAVIQRCRKREPGEIGISAITLSELQYGVSKSTQRKKNQIRLDDFLMPFEILAYGSDEARIYGELRFQLEKKGTPVGSLDMLIAAQAIRHDLVLITNDEREFRRIKRLKVENWAL